MELKIIKKLQPNAPFHKIGVNMSLKTLQNHLDFFSDNLGDFSDKYDERLHQNIATIEQHFKGKDSCYILSEYCYLPRNITRPV